MSLLAVDNLHLWYDAGGGRVVRAVDGVSFTLEHVARLSVSSASPVAARAALLWR